jgi:hypothetical protein
MNEILRKLDMLKQPSNIGYVWAAKDLMSVLSCWDFQLFEQKILKVEKELTALGAIAPSFIIIKSEFFLSALAASKLCLLSDLRLFSVQTALDYFLDSRFSQEKTEVSGSNKASPANSNSQAAQTAQTDRSGFIYLVENESTDLCKIGYSKDVFRRVADMQVSNPIKIIILYRYFTIDAPKLESDLHKYYKLQHLRGEWFKLTSYQKNSFLSTASALDREIEKSVELLGASDSSARIEFLAGFSASDISSNNQNAIVNKTAKKIQSRLSRQGVSVVLDEVRTELRNQLDFIKDESKAEKIVERYFIDAANKKKIAASAKLATTTSLEANKAVICAFETHCSNNIEPAKINPAIIPKISTANQISSTKKYQIEPKIESKSAVFVLPPAAPVAQVLGLESYLKTINLEKISIDKNIRKAQFELSKKHIKLTLKELLAAKIKYKLTGVELAIAIETTLSLQKT